MAQRHWPLALYPYCVSAPAIELRPQQFRCRTNKTVAWDREQIAYSIFVPCLRSLCCMYLFVRSINNRNSNLNCSRQIGNEKYVDEHNVLSCRFSLPKKNVILCTHSVGSTHSHCTGLGKDANASCYWNFMLFFSKDESYIVRICTTRPAITNPKLRNIE